MSDLENLLIAENEQMRLKLRAYEEELKKTMAGAGGAGPAGVKPKTTPGQTSPASPGVAGTAPPAPGRQDKKAAQAAQRELVKKIQDRAWADYEAGKKRKFECGQPAHGVVDWLVFDRETKDLFGEGRGQQAYAAWVDAGASKPFSACLVVQRDHLDAAEERVRGKRNGNGVGNGIEKRTW